MKPILLLLISFLFIFPLAAQDKQQDSIATEIKSLEKSKAELSAKAEALRNQVNEKFTLIQGLKSKIDEIEITLKEDKAELARLQKKGDLTSQEKKWMQACKNAQKEKEKWKKSLVEMEQHSNKSLEMLDKVVVLENELDQKIRELKAKDQGK